MYRTDQDDQLDFGVHLNSLLLFENFDQLCPMFDPSKPLARIVLACNDFSHFITRAAQVCLYIAAVWDEA